ncbi:kinase that interacts with cdc31p [Savitreella phatthalungensis]
MPSDVCGPYQRSEVIGRGSYGVVYRGINRETNRLVAIKVLNLDTVEDEVADIQKEIILLQSLRAGDAQNVVNYHGCFLNGTRLWIVMDCCEGGSIRTLMKAGSIEERFIGVIVREVLTALAFIHKSNIIHRDVKAANILVRNDGRIQLCDFGVAAQLAAQHLKRNTFVGTPYWMAPEVISDGLSYNFKADIWSLGITIYEIAYGNPPYADQEPMRAVFLIPRSKPPRIESGAFSPAMREFAAFCLCEKPEERASATDLQKLKFIKASSKLSTSILVELIERYEAWRRSGGVRKSLARPDESSDDEEGDGDRFGWEDVPQGNGDWDFGDGRDSTLVAKNGDRFSEHADSLASAETILNGSVFNTVKPIATSLKTDAATQKDNHPLMKLFQSPIEPSDGQLKAKDSPGLPPPSLARGLLGPGSESGPGTPQSEAASIELPDLNAVSLGQAAAVASSSPPNEPLPKPPTSGADTYAVDQTRGTGRPPMTNGSASSSGTPVRLNPPMAPASSRLADLADLPPPIPPQFQSRGSSPTRQILPPSQPNSPSRTIRPTVTLNTLVAAQPGFLSSGDSPSDNLLPDIPLSAISNFTANSSQSSLSRQDSVISETGTILGSVLHASQSESTLSAAGDSVASLPLSASTRSILTSNGEQMNGDNVHSVNLLQFPPQPHELQHDDEDGADQLAELGHGPLTHSFGPYDGPDKLSLPRSGSGGGAGVNGQARLVPSSVPELDPLVALDLDVLTAQDPARIHAELERVVAQMMGYLEVIEDGLGHMSFVR